MTKNRVLQIRLSEIEYDLLKAGAEHDERPLSDYARRRLLAQYHTVKTIEQKPVPIVDAPLPRSSPVEAAKQDLERIQQTREFKPYTKETQAGRKKR